MATKPKKLEAEVGGARSNIAVADFNGPDHAWALSDSIRATDDQL